MSWKIKNNLIHTDVHDCQQTKAVEATTSNSNNHSAAHSSFHTSTTFKLYDSDNTVARHEIGNSRGLKIPDCKTG